MNPRQLEQDLQLPNIKASLIAYFDAAQQKKWYIRFFVPGPDGRYSPGVAVVSSSRVDYLVKSLEKAYQKMKVLENEKYTGKYSEDFVLRCEVSDTLSITVSSEESQFLFWSFKNVRLHLYVSNKTNTFKTSFNSDDSRTIINILSSAENLANQLISQL